MTTKELKKKIIRSVFLTEDKELLKSISLIIGIEDSDETYYFNDEQLNAIEEAREQYFRGEYISNDALEKEIEEWLDE